MSSQRYLMATLAVLLVSASISGATRGRLLLSSESPPNSQTINSILSKNVMVFSFGEKTQVPVPILNGAADVGSFSTPVAPSSNSNTGTSTILFACRAVGNQIYTTNASDSSAYVNSAAHADLWCGPGSAKIAIKHFFSNATAKTEAFIGGAPSFEAVDGSGIAIGQKVATTSATSTRSGDGGLGSVGDVLLSINGQGSLSDVTWIIRNNELGGQIAPNQQPLALASTNLENFALTGAENVPNAPLFVPYQADYTFFTGARPTFPQPGVVTGSPPSTSSSG
ncbi:MAG: hypothetical protein FRX49_00867 [Trebouxia sp. A1-2]|nr:MAG: hypothetical protein FRX49_00867 [Trebouxia sp. A1-2]